MGTIRVDINTETNQYTANYRNFSRPLTIKTRNDSPGISIVSLIPNPVGQDFLLESVTLHNSGEESSPIDEMLLRDASGRLWVLQGSIGAGVNRTIVRNGMPMSLNNGGDTIQLLDGTGSVIDEVSYESSQEGVEIVHP